MKRRSSNKTKHPGLGGVAAALVLTFAIALAPRAARAGQDLASPSDCASADAPVLDPESFPMLASLSKASEPGEKDDAFSRYRNTALYRKASALCQARPDLFDNTTDDLDLMLDVARGSASQSFSATFRVNLMAATDFVNHQGMAHALTSLLKSPEFHLAIFDCAKEDPERTQRAMTRLFWAEAVGKTAGLAATAGAYYAAYRLTAFFGSRMIRHLPRTGGRFGSLWRASRLPWLTLGLVMQSSNMGRDDGTRDLSEHDIRQALLYLDKRLHDDPAADLRNKVQIFREEARTLEQRLKSGESLTESARSDIHRQHERLRAAIRNAESWIDWITERKQRQVSTEQPNLIAAP